jgi:hypothetical protein
MTGKPHLTTPERQDNSAAGSSELEEKLPKTPFFEDRNIFEMMIRRSFGEITLELTAEQFARLNR